MSKRAQQYIPSLVEALPVFAPDQKQENIYLQADDGAVSQGVLYRPADDPTSKVCIYVMHPRGRMSRHYLAGYIPPRGMALFGHDPRYLNNDADCLHERLLLDLAAGIRHLRDIGFETIVGVGNSGGGSLFGYYQEQAEKAPDERRTAAPSGDPVNLTDAEMPPFDFYVVLASISGLTTILFQEGLTGEMITRLFILGSLGIGVVIGILVISRIMSWALKKYPAPTMYAILGLIFGSLYQIYPGFEFNWNGLIAVITLILGVVISMKFGVEKQ